MTYTYPSKIHNFKDQEKINKLANRENVLRKKRRSN